MSDDYFPCPAVTNGRHEVSSKAQSSTYYDHVGNDLGTPRSWTDTDVVPYASVTDPCIHCGNRLLTINLNYPQAYRWDNRQKDVDAGAKGGWTLYEGMHQITYLIEEEPTFGFPSTPTPAFLVAT